MRRIRFPARVVLFDWDGTLLNSYGADSGAYLEMFRALGIRWKARDFERHYSPNWLRVYRAARLPHAKWDLADRLWKRAYQEQNPGLLPGARSVLQKLHRDFRLGSSRAEADGGSCANSAHSICAVICASACAVKTRADESQTLRR